MVDFEQMKNYVPEEEVSNDFAVINAKGLKCVMTVKMLEGDKEFNKGETLVQTSLQVVDTSEEYAGRYIGNFGKAHEWNLSHKAGDVVEYKKDGVSKSFTRDKSGLQMLSDFIHQKVDPEMATLNSEEALTKALEFMNDKVFITNAFVSKKKDKDGNPLQGFRVVRMATEEELIEDSSSSEVMF